MKGCKRISRREFYARGAFSNPDLIRTQSGNQWAYYAKERTNA